MSRYQVICLSMLFSITASVAQGQEFPDMVGLWKGQVRIVQSGQLGTDRLQAGGAIISEIDLELTIDAQDGETFIGRTRSSQASANAPVTHVWGSIRSTGAEALFITSAGGRGQLWFESATSFEYCYNAISDEGSIVSYCARLRKQ